MEPKRGESAHCLLVIRQTSPDTHSYRNLVNFILNTRNCIQHIIENKSLLLNWVVVFPGPTLSLTLILIDVAELPEMWECKLDQSGYQFSHLTMAQNCP